MVMTVTTEEETMAHAEDLERHPHQVILEGIRLTTYRKNSLRPLVSLPRSPNSIPSSRSMPSLLGTGIQKIYDGGF